MFKGGSFGGGVDTYDFEGIDAENDAKLAFARHCKRMQGKGIVEVKKVKPGRWHKGGYAVVCTYTPEGIEKDRQEFLHEMRKDDPDFKLLKEDWPGEYNYGRTQNPRKKKRVSKYPSLADDRTEAEMLQDDHSKERQPHRKGWRALHQQTRQRYWRPENNNWKQTRKTKYRID